jgi:hypothetical protein|tara:strand:+ start:158 stop:469 length:312 start_codon:yes stop_codon:yes gene_type:complete
MSEDKAKDLKKEISDKIPVNMKQMEDILKYETLPYYVIAGLYAFSLLYFIDTSLIEGFSSYDSCIKQGYDRTFCLNSPFDACVNCDLDLKDKFIPKRFFTYNS